MTEPDLLSLPCYLNGEFTTLPNAKISVMDRGFIFGDGVYEVVPVYKGRPFRFKQHMARLDRSLTELRIANPMAHDQWLKTALYLINQYASSAGVRPDAVDQLIYIQVTRGVAMREHSMLPNLTPTVFVMSNVMKPPSQEQRDQGVTCVSADDFRWEKAHIKSVSLLGAVFARQISFDAGALETVMFRDGFLSEAAASNVWVVKNKKVLGVPKDHLVLQGIRYDLIAEICHEQGLDFELRRIPRDEVFDADELMLSSATKEVLPITLLDGKAVGNGWPGPIYQRIHTGYQLAKARSASAESANLSA